MRKNEPGPDVVSKAVQQAIEAAKPHARYEAGVPFAAKLVLRLGQPVWDLVVRRMYAIVPLETRWRQTEEIPARCGRGHWRLRFL